MAHPADSETPAGRSKRTAGRTVPHHYRPSRTGTSRPARKHDHRSHVLAAPSGTGSRRGTVSAGPDRPAQGLVQQRRLRCPVRHHCRRRTGQRAAVPGRRHRRTAWLPAAPAVRIAYRAGLRAQDTIITIGLTRLPSLAQTYEGHQQRAPQADRYRRHRTAGNGTAAVTRLNSCPVDPDGSLTLAVSRGGGSQLTVANAPQMAYRRITGLLNGMADILAPQPGRRIAGTPPDRCEPQWTSAS